MSSASLFLAVVASAVSLVGEDAFNPHKLPVSPDHPAPVAAGKGTPSEPAQPSPAEPGDKEAAAVKDAAAKESAGDPWYHELLHSGAMGYMLSGGFFMWPILAM